MMIGMMTTTKTKKTPPQQHVVRVARLLEKARAVLHLELVRGGLLLELVRVAQLHQILRKKLKKKKIQVGWLNIELMTTEPSGLKMKMRHGIIENPVKPIGLFGKIR
jgi:hypothetical protein